MSNLAQDLLLRFEQNLRDEFYQQYMGMPCWLDTLETKDRIALGNALEKTFNSAKAETEKQN